MRKIFLLLVLAVISFSGVLNPKETQVLLHEEKISKVLRDGYFYFKNLYPFIGGFDRLMRSEVIHLIMVDNVIKRYNLPVKTNRGYNRFNSKEVKKEYDELVKAGTKSHIEALKASIKKEVDDIDYLTEMEPFLKHKDIKILIKIIITTRKNHYVLLRGYLKKYVKDVCKILDKKYCRNYKRDMSVHKEMKGKYYFINLDEINLKLHEYEPYQPHF